MSTRILISTLVAATLLFGQAKKLKEIKPGMNFFKKDQDIQMGREYAKEIEQQYEVLPPGQLTDYINGLGQKIAAQPQANGFPFVFKVVNDPTINAFALPGGPIYINTGILLNAENEGQLMGVIAHEASHVALRHSTNQVSKSYMIQIPAMLAGAYGQSKGGITGMLAQMGVGLGANGLLMKFSRGAEQQADLLGARMMAQIGYNPIEMARFFETLEAKSGGGKSGGMDFFSSHPNPGNRSKYVSEEVTLLPQRNFNADTGKFQKMKQLAKNLPAPKKKPGQPGQAPTQPPQNSDGSRTWTGDGFKISYPGAWLGLGEANSPTVTIAPKEGVKQDNNGVQIGLGVIVARYEDDDGRHDFKADTQKLIQQVIQQNPSMGKVNPQINQHQINGRNAYVTRLVSKSALDGGDEIDTVVTLEHKGGILYLVFIAPQREMQNVQRDFDNILNSLQLQ